VPARLRSGLHPAFGDTLCLRAVRETFAREADHRMPQPMSIVRESERWRAHLASWGWFLAWMLAGLVGAIGLVSLGVLALAPAAVIGGGSIMASRTARRSAWGLLSGAGITLLFIAYMHRDGPGTTCWHTATASGCDEHLDPRPWLIVGLILVIVGVAGQLLSLHGRHGTERPTLESH
jgi:hypothetical protein